MSHAAPPGEAAAVISWVTRAREFLGRPVDGSSLAIFRICLGLLFAYEVWVKISDKKHLEIAAAKFHFSYPYLGWVPVPATPEGGLTLLWVLFGLGVLLALGFAFRLTAAVSCVLLCVYFLAEKSLYINHVYLYCLLLGLVSFSSASSTWSVDSWLGSGPFAPKQRGVARFADLFLLRFQMGVVYIYAGVAKLNSDWLSGSPLDIWLTSKARASQFCEILNSPQTPLAMAWGGLFLDLAVVPMLLWRRTRVVALLLALGFHVVNAVIFGVASFPWLSLVLSSLFFSPDWPRRALAQVAQKVSALAALTKPTQSTASLPPVRSLGRFAFTLVVMYCAFQVLVPLRHHLYPGDVTWTEEGHRFSWRMMLRNKTAEMRYLLRDPASGKLWGINPNDHLTGRQISWIAGRPDQLVQYARFLADEHEKTGAPRPQVFVDTRVSLNGRPKHRLIDRSVDLAAIDNPLLPIPGLKPAPTEPPGRPPQRDRCGGSTTSAETSLPSAASASSAASSSESDVDSLPE